MASSNPESLQRVIVPTLFGVSLLSKIRYLRERSFLQRLFSTFANGWPGKGLFILRLAISTFLIHCALDPLTAATSSEQTVPLVLALGLGAFLLIGLFTPIAGISGALLEVWTAFSHQEEWWACILAAAIALALALLGPGSWSLDAIAYGRKRISIHNP